jgi:hypothetical protein
MSLPARSILILSISFLSGVFSQLVDWRSIDTVGVAVARDQSVPAGDLPELKSEFPSFLEFRDNLRIDAPDRIVGVYVPGVLALKIVYQPAAQPNYVSATPGTATLFSSAERRGTIGLLAHNYSSGSDFFALQPDQSVLILYGDGGYEKYRILVVEQYQAVSPHSPYSDFIPLDASDKELTAHTLFYEMYGGENPLVFQTCLERDNEPSWGRHFVVAVQYEEHPATVCALKKLTGTGCGAISASRDLTSDIRFVGVYAR